MVAWTAPNYLAVHSISRLARWLWSNFFYRVLDVGLQTFTANDVRSFLLGVKSPHPFQYMSLILRHRVWPVKSLRCASRWWRHCANIKIRSSVSSLWLCQWRFISSGGKLYRRVFFCACSSAFCYVRCLNDSDNRGSRSV